jgi:hypothetical protein
MPSLCGFRHIAPALPRHGLPHPFRSAFAVSHDLGGLLLLEPCDVFRPHTPIRFFLPFPRLLAFGLGSFDPARWLPGGGHLRGRLPAGIRVGSPKRSCCDTTTPAAEAAGLVSVFPRLSYATLGKPPNPLSRLVILWPGESRVTPAPPFAAANRGDPRGMFLPEEFPLPRRSDLRLVLPQPMADPARKQAPKGLFALRIQPPLDG